MIDIELDILLRKKLGRKRNEREYIIPRRYGKPRLALRNFLKRFFEKVASKTEEANYWRRIKMREFNDWITIQSEEDWPEEGKLIIVYLKRHDVYHIGYRVLDKSFRKLVYNDKSYLKMKSITAWKYLETYEG